MEQSNKLEELIKTSKNKEELRDSIKEAGIELSDEEMDAVAGGFQSGDPYDDRYWREGIIRERQR